MHKLTFFAFTVVGVFTQIGCHGGLRPYPLEIHGKLTYPDGEPAKNVMVDFSSSKAETHYQPTATNGVGAFEGKRSYGKYDVFFTFSLPQEIKDIKGFYIYTFHCAVGWQCTYFPLNSVVIQSTNYFNLERVLDLGVITIPRPTILPEDVSHP